jgi:DNA-binding IclR family transcriptional regulator
MGEGRALGALSISCPAVRLPENRCPEFGALVHDGAERISRELAAH